ncbi:uncharacterized protein [Littorina saxatilis]|uniref:uncharacterized protein isoform X1 n=1 Tax=Littorina saxatilis TaxID=31220 RepID=UPI0038B4796E
MDRPQQGSSFTNMHKATGEPPRPKGPPPPPPPPPHPPPPISGQASPGYTSTGISSTPPSFPVGNVSSFFPDYSQGKSPTPAPHYPGVKNPTVQLPVVKQHEDPRSYRGPSDKPGTQTTSPGDRQPLGQPNNSGKLFPPSHSRGEEIRNPSLRDLRGSRENLDDMYDGRSSRQTLDARSAADSVDFQGSRQNLDARSDHRGSREVLNGRPSRPPQGDYRGSRDVLNEKNRNPRAPADLQGSRGNLNTTGYMAGSRDGLNDRSPPYHASKNSLSSQDVQLTVKRDGHQGSQGLNPHGSPGLSDKAGAPESGVLRFSSAAPVIHFPKASAKKNVRAPELRVSASPTSPGYGNGAYLGQGQGRLTSGGVINLAMDDPIGEEPAEVRAMRGSRPPVGSTSGISGAHGTGIHSPMQNMAMARRVEKRGGRPLFGLWISICVFLCFCTLFFGLVPLIFYWQAREEWDSGNTAQAKKSLRLARISFVVALLALTGGVVGLAVQVHLSQQAIHDAYRQNAECSWQQGPCDYTHWFHWHYAGPFPSNT